MRNINRYTRKRTFPNFQLNLTLCYAWLCVLHCSIGNCVELIAVSNNLSKKLVSCYKEMVSALFLWRNGLLRGKLRVDAKNSNFENFESAFYMKSVSIPLNQHFSLQCIPLDSRSLISLLMLLTHSIA